MKYFDKQPEMYPTEMLETYSSTSGLQTAGLTGTPETIPLEKITPGPDFPQPPVPPVPPVTPASTEFEAIPPTRPEMVNREQDFTPPVGWLVCVDGPCRGKDFAIHAGYNYIGRAPSNDICITGDLHISSDRHAMVAFSTRGNKFTFAPVNGRGIVAVNDEDVYVPVQLKFRDVIEIGSTKLYFVPLCDEEFDWKKF